MTPAATLIPTFTATPTATATATATPTPTPTPVVAAIGVTKSAAPSSVAPGGTVTFTILVTNTGVNPATAVTASDPLPGTMTYLSCTTSQGACLGPPVGTNGTVTAAFGTIAAGVTVTLTIQAQAPPTPGTLVNVVTVTGGNVSGGTASGSTFVIVGNGIASDVPALGPGTLALLALALVWVGLRALRGFGP